MVSSFFLGLLFGFVCVLGLQALAFLYVLEWIDKKNKAAVDLIEKSVPCDLNGESTINFPCNKQGYLWILEPEKISKVNAEGDSNSKDKKEKNNYVEVVPVKRHARIEDDLLILSGPGSSRTATIDLSNCTVLAVSASDQSTRKWAKRYPIMLESKEPALNIYNNAPKVFLYTETSWEKESWCKSLRLASTTDKAKLQTHLKLIQNYENYLASLNAEYPLKYSPFSEYSSRTSRTEPGRVRTFFKKLTKKASNKQGISDGKSEKRTSFESNESSRSFLLDLQEADERGSSDEGVLCFNLLFSRLFFDVKMSDKISTSIQARIQRSLSNMRIPSYIGEITCTNFKLGSLPPHIHKLKPIQTELNELMAFEVDFEFSGGLLVNLETRLDVGASELRNDFEEENNLGLLEGLEHYGRQCTSNHELCLNSPLFDSKDENSGPDGLKHSKSASWTSYTSRWKTIVHSIATKVNQVPLSLAIRSNSIRGTLRLHIKPPPSDRIWYGFVSMPEIDWYIESSIGERKIASNRIASLISNRFKASIYSTMVLPNCESIPIPWMLSENDDWAPLKAAPFIWINHENTPNNSSKIHENTPKPDISITKIESTNYEKKDEIIKSIIVAKERTSDVNMIQMETSSSNYEFVNPDLRSGLLNLEKQESNASEASVKSCPPVVQQTNWRGDSFVQNREDSKTNWRGESFVLNREDSQPAKANRRARVLDFGKRVGDKLGENKKKIEEKGRSLVDKMRENINNTQ